MAPLTQAEVDSIVTELGPHLANDGTKTELGKKVYRSLFTHHPEYITKFSKLQGLSGIDQVMGSDGIKHLGLTLIAQLSQMLVAGAKDAELNAVLAQSRSDHVSRPVSTAEFLAGGPAIVAAFEEILTKNENKAAMKKFVDYILPIISQGIG